jgi:excisionase family DNA binding protein
MGMTEEDRRRLKGNRAAIERLAVKPLDAAVMLGESRSTVYRLIHAGKLDAVKRGATTLVIVASIHRYLESLPAFEGGVTFGRQEETVAA